MTSRRSLALILTGVTTLGLLMVFLGVVLNKLPLTIFGSIISVSPILGIVVYVCWYDHCEEKQVQYDTFI